MIRSSAMMMMCMCSVPRQPVLPFLCAKCA